MNKIFCDICGKEITDAREIHRYKIKRLTPGFDFSFSWEPLDVHYDCWYKLCKLIKQDVLKEKNNDI